MLPEPVELAVHNASAKKTALLRISNAGFAAIFELYLGNERIGYANCFALNTHDHLICDLRIGSERSPRRPSWLKAFASSDPRGHGWGSLLLQVVIDETRRCGFRTLMADVTPADDAGNRDLVAWYGRHGFVASRTAAACPHWRRLKRSL